MDLPVLAADDPVANRKVWAEWLRRPNWQEAPGADGEIQESRTPWDVGLMLATEHWPSSQAVIDSDEYEYQDDVQDRDYDRLLRRARGRRSHRPRRAAGAPSQPDYNGGPGGPKRAALR